MEFKKNEEYRFKVFYKDLTTNPRVHKLSNSYWITNLSDLWDTTPKQKSFTLQDVKDYYMEEGSNGNSYLIDCINDDLEHSKACGECMKSHNLLIVDIKLD